MNPIPFVVGGLVITGAGAAAVGFHLGIFGDAPDPALACESFPLQPLTSAELAGPVGMVRLHVDNRGDVVHVIFCVFDAAAQKRFERVDNVPAHSTAIFETSMPRGDVKAVVVYTGVSPTGTLSGSLDGNLGDCSSHLIESNDVVTVSGDGISADSKSGGCAAGGSWGGSSGVSSAGYDPGASQMGQTPLVPIPNEPGHRGGVVWATAGTSAIGLGALLTWQWSRVKITALGLFSRLQRSTLLDQKVRSQMHELVTQEPGVNANTIAQRLELGQGQTLHHLRILVREKLLAAVRMPGATHYFLAGRFAPAQMRALAVLRSAGASGLLQWVRASPGRTLGEAARHLGVSHSRASKLARRLADVGLLVRTPEGRTLRLRPGPFAAPATS